MKLLREYIRGLLTEPLTRPEIEDAIADASFNSAKSSQHRWSPRQPIIDYIFDERNGAWKYTATIPDSSSNADKWPSFSSEPEEDLETFLSRVEEPIQLNLLEQTDVREYIRGLLIEQNVLAQGMCFPFAYQKAVAWFEDHFTKGGPGRSPKRHPDLNDKSKFKVVHGTVTDQWKKSPKPVVHAWVEMGDLVFDDQTRHTKPNGVEKEFYYETYQPEIYKEFTAEEALGNCVKYGGEGPWDEDLYAQMQQRDVWMNEIHEHTKELLTEAAMGPTDLPEDVFVVIKDKGGRFKFFYAIKNDAGEYVRTGGDAYREGIPYGFVGIGKPYTSDGPCGGAREVTGSRVKQGWGPMLYDVAMEWASQNGNGLMSDRMAVSPSAHNVWRYYMSNRGDVKSDQLDNLDDELTPGVEADNCSQHISAGDMNFFDWQDSPLSKKYTKSPTTMNALEAAGKLVIQ